MSTLVGALRDQAERRPNAVAFTYLKDGEAEDGTLTFGGLHRRASDLAGVIVERTGEGDRVPVLLPAGLGFIEAFFGCLYAGRVPVPLAPPRRRGVAEDCRRIERIAIRTGAQALLTTPSVMEQLIDQSPALRDAGVFRIDIDAAAGGAPSGKVGATHIADPHAGDVAYLQYTSGSTIEPRGVMVTHASLLAATSHAAKAFVVTESSRLVSWLPHFHDMGLAGIILQTIASGCQTWLMSPLSFASKPDRWLSAISRYQATHSGGPDSAYELCARRAASAADGLRLESWRCAFTGAEPVRVETLERFARAFAPSGFTKDQFCPTYGLAEATAQVTGGPVGIAPRIRAFAVGGATVASDDGDPASTEPARTRSTSVVSCGRSWLRTTVRIVDPVSRDPVPAGAVGEIWIRGPQVAAGYFGEPVATRNVFRATLAGSTGPAYLRSGDLGAVVDGELFVLGRLKDTIILNGVNHQPDAIEQAVLRHASDIRAGSVAAIGSPQDGRERLVVLVEKRPDIASEAARRFRDAIFDELDLTVQLVAFVPVGAFPRTTSGKIKRCSATSSLRRRPGADPVRSLTRRASSEVESGELRGISRLLLGARATLFPHETTRCGGRESSDPLPLVGMAGEEGFEPSIS